MNDPTPTPPLEADKDEGVTTIPLAEKYIGVSGQKHTQRYLAYHDTKGVFLGGEAIEIWSYNGKPPADRPKKAKTFSTEEFNKTFRGQEGVRAHIVFPDLPDNMASEDRVADSGLPRWSS